ncbi:MAG: hypothetical protein QOE58_2827 [Actinomycetota bacterium]|jgi:acetyltransferase-like isoleucine patch superfamily enzyme|nr:hypothetical protein [Actinomycetota bacterium]
MTVERFLNKAATARSILRGRLFVWAYGIDAPGEVRFGRSCIIRGGHRIRIGHDVTVTDQTWLNIAMPTGRITIGDRVGLGRRTILSAAASISVGDDTIFGPNVLITDHNHEHSAMVPVSHQGITPPIPVSIGRGCWIGANTVILPGTSVPDFCVVGANSVLSARSTVTIDGRVPRLIAGAPARPIR